MLSLEKIQEARRRIADTITPTPLREWHYLRTQLGGPAPVFLKLETLQRTGSFKVRGAANKMLSMSESGQRPTHVVAASAGNHAQAVAFVASKLKIPSTIVMPEGSPLVKASATADYGAKVVLHGLLYDEAFKRAQEILSEIPGAAYIHAFEDEAVICGQGTVGVEIHEQLLAVGNSSSALQVVVPIGGGGLVSGVALALKELRPQTKIYGVVAEAVPAMADSFHAGRIMNPAGRTRTLAEGLAVKKVSPLTFEVIQKTVDEIVCVSEDEISAAIATLMERGKLVVEGAGAAGVAAVLAHKLKLDPSIPTVVILSGGNIDMNSISNILERGFARTGRWLDLTVRVEDKPGELARVARTLADLRANVLEVSHDRISPRNPPGQTSIRFHLEARGAEHVKQIFDGLRKEGFEMVES